MGSGELALLYATAQPRHPVRQQDETRQGYDRAANAKQEEPPTVDAIALGPIHDMEAPDEIEAQYHHAFALYKLGKLTSAKSILKKVIKKNKKHALAYLYLYNISNKENQKDDVSYYKSKVLELDDSLMGK